MNAIRASWCAMSVLVLAMGCSAADGEESPTGVGSAQPNGARATETNFATDGAPDPSAPPKTATQGSPSDVRLAQLDFEDGTQVIFEALGDGVLVTELGSQDTAPHLDPNAGMTALEAFQALAPTQAVPEALMTAHLRLHPSDVTMSTAKDQVNVENNLREPGASLEEGGSDVEQLDADLEHNGQFQQSALPFKTFAAQMCDFPNRLPNYKHASVTAGHTHATANINTAYYAVGSDVGTITAKACVDKKCSVANPVQAGGRASAFYDAGLSCKKDCSHILGIPLGCVEICKNKLVKFEGVFTAISSKVSYHDCSRFTL
jgi:hypothetical protein